MELETLCTWLLSQGFHTHLAHSGPKRWSCELQCGVAVLDGRLPRPRGDGPTAIEAVQAAQADLAEIRKRKN